MPIDQELIRQLFDFSFIHFQSAAALGISFYLIRTCLRILLPFYQILREAVQTWPFITFASTIYTFFESWSNFIAQYTRVHEGTQYTLSSSSTLIIFLWVQSVQQHHRNKFLKLFFLPLSANLWRICRHLISYVCLFLCWAAKDWTDCVTVRTVPCMLDMYGSFCAWRCPFVGWLQHDIHSSFKALHFFGASSKKWQDFPPTHAMNSGAFLLFKCEPRLTGHKDRSVRLELKRGSAQKDFTKWPTSP